ncbi:hypothetical protein AAA733_000194 [Providencia rettgeri]
MIIGNDINPKRKVYYFGALIIDVLMEFSQKMVSFDDIYHLMRSRYGISIELFMLSLDWLFIISVVDGKDGMVIKCF